MRFLTILLFTFSFSFQTYSQKIELGLNAGVNLIPTDSSGINNEFKFGLDFGAFAEHKLNTNLSIHIGLNITQKNKQYSSSYTTLLTDEISTFTNLIGIDESQIESINSQDFLTLDVIYNTNGHVNLTYINLPVYLKFHYKSINIGVGPYLNYILKAKYSEQTVKDIPLLKVVDIAAIDSTGIAKLFLPKDNETVNSYYTSKSKINSIDFGIGTTIQHRIDNFSYNLSYFHGLTEYSKTNTKIKRNHQIFNLSIKYYLPLKNKTNGKTNSSL